MEAEREVMKRLLAATLFLFLLEGSSQIISAQTCGVKSLRGLRGVEVLIEIGDSDAEKAGLTKSQLQTDVEVELRKAGIPVLTDDKRQNTPGKPILYVNVNSMVLSGDEGLYVHNIIVVLYQLVDLRREAVAGVDGETWWQTVSTWDRSNLGINSKSNFKKGVREIVRDYVNEFINDYLTVNPK